MSCIAGTYASADDTVCNACPLNTYQEQERSESCQNCPGETGTLDLGSDRSADCIGTLHLLSKLYQTI